MRHLGSVASALKPYRKSDKYPVLFAQSQDPWDRYSPNLPHLQALGADLLELSKTQHPLQIWLNKRDCRNNSFCLYTLFLKVLRFQPTFHTLDQSLYAHFCLVLNFHNMISLIERSLVAHSSSIFLWVACVEILLI